MQCTPNPADREPATLKTYPPLPQAAPSISDFRHGESLALLPLPRFAIFLTGEYKKASEPEFARKEYGGQL